MKYNVGDRVRIKSLDWYNENKDEYSRINCGYVPFITDMLIYCGKVLTICAVNEEFSYYYMKGCKYVFTDEMIEGLVEEETKNWADTSIPDGPYTVTYDSPSMNDSVSKNIIYNVIILPKGYIFKDENGNVINATKIVLEKKKKEYDKGTKVRHKTKGMVETVVGICKIKYMGAWVDGVIYEGNDTNTGEPMTFVRVKEDFENNFGVWQH